MNELASVAARSPFRRKCGAGEYRTGDHPNQNDRPESGRAILSGASATLPAAGHVSEFTRTRFAAVSNGTQNTLGRAIAAADQIVINYYITTCYGETSLHPPPTVIPLPLPMPKSNANRAASAHGKEEAT